MSSISIVSRGISHPEWLESFYPEDIPSDWRLSFFAHEFTSCALTLAELESLNCAPSALSKELPEGFQCYVELDFPPPKGISFEDPCIAGILLSEGCEFDDSLVQLLCRSAKPVGVIPSDSSLHRLPVCHLPDSLQLLHCHTVRSEELLDLRRLKTRLIAIQSKDNQLFLMDYDVSIEQLRQVTVLADLLSPSH